MKVTHSGNISFFHTDEINDDINMYNLWVETCTTENKHDCQLSVNLYITKKYRHRLETFPQEIIFHEDEMNDCMNLCTDKWVQNCTSEKEYITVSCLYITKQYRHRTETQESEPGPDNEGVGENDPPAERNSHGAVVPPGYLGN